MDLKAAAVFNARMANPQRRSFELQQDCLDPATGLENTPEYICV
jgi:hypothetical protein